MLLRWSSCGLLRCSLRQLPRGEQRGGLRLPYDRLRGNRMFDDAAAQADLAIVEHGRLPRCDSPLCVFEIEREVAVCLSCCAECAGRVGLPIACFRTAREIFRGRMAGNPTGIARAQCMAEQP